MKKPVHLCTGAEASLFSTCVMEPQAQLEVVSNYYGETLKSRQDLLTSACCSTDAVPSAHRSILAKLHPDVTSQFYGCGSPIPDFLEGTTVLDLGCGTGRDVYLASALVGQEGKVIGVDMTEAQLDIARAHVKYHAKAFFDDASHSNVDFRHGFIEDLATANISDKSVDVVISNCVCNLSPEKTKVFGEVFRTLKDGGEFYFSDVYADRRLSEQAAKHPVLVAECLGGALYFEDFRRIMASVGFCDIRVVSCVLVNLNDATLLPLVPGVNFYSVTIRAFKAPQLEDRRENYGQICTFVPEQQSSETAFTFDIDNTFTAQVACPIDANTATILEEARFKSSFKVTPRASHRGLFTRAKEGPCFPLALDCFRPSVSSTPSTAVLTNGGTTARESCCAPSKSVAKSSGCRPSVPSTKQSCCSSSNLKPTAQSNGSATPQQGSKPASCKPGTNC